MAKKKKTRAKAARVVKKKPGPKPGAKKRRGRKKAGRPSGLRAASTAEIQRELERREKSLARLQAKRDALAAQLDEIDSEISALGGATTGAKRGPGRPRKKTGRGPGRPRKNAPRAASAKRKTTRKRPKNDANLVESLKKTLKGKTMSVTEAADAVKKAGYKTSSDNFRTIVNQTLLGKKGDFKRVARGQYTAK